MCSILKRAALCGIIGSSALAATFSGGCQRMTPPQPDRLKSTPLVIDAAMEHREGDRSTAYYANGDTIAGGTGYLYRTSDRLPTLWWRIVAPMVATGNIVALPGTIWFNPPW